MKTLIAISFVALGSCMAQGPLVNGVNQSNGANLCMTVSGTSIIASGCVTGLSTQQFTVTSDGLVHASASTCVVGQARPSAGRNFAPGTPLVLAACPTTRTGLYNVDPSVFSRTGLLCVMDLDTSTYCYSTASATPGQSVVLTFGSSSVQPSQRWSNTITARLASANLSSSALFDSQGCLRDLMGQSLTALGCHLVGIGSPTSQSPLGTAVAAAAAQIKIGSVAVTVVGNGGNIVAQGGGNIVAQGGGNIVAQGGGNVVPPGSQVQIQDTNGNPISDAVINTNGSNIVAQGGGNIVAQGGGNIVAQGGGNFAVQSVGGGFTFRTGTTSIRDATVNALQQATLTLNNSAYKSTSTPYAVTSVAADPGPWAPGSTHTVTWQGSGTAASGETITVYVQAGSQNLALCPNVAPSAGRCSLVTPNLPGTAAIINVWDSLSRKNAYYASQIQIAAAAAQAFNITAVSADPGPWTPGSSHTISWQGTGSPASGETVWVYFQTASQTLTLCSNVAPSAGRCTGVAPNVPGQSGAVNVWDSITRKNAYVASQVLIAAPTAPSAQPFTLSAAFRIDGNVPSPTATLAWAAASPHQLQWSWTGTAASNETVSFWLGSLRLASGIPALQGAYNLPANSARSGSSSVLILRDDLTGKQVNGPAVQVK